jgi:hypothetical protein
VTPPEKVGPIFEAWTREVGKASEPGWGIISYLINGKVAPYSVSRPEVKYGPYRRAVGGAEAPDPYALSSSRRPRSALARPQRHPKRHPLGIAHWGTLARPAREGYPPYQTCHRRFQQWIREGVLSRILEALAGDLKRAREPRPFGVLHRRHLRGGQKGGFVWDKTKRGKGNYEVHGVLRPLFSSSRPPHRESFTARSHPCWRDSLRAVRRGASFEASWRPSVRRWIPSMRHF